MNRKGLLTLNLRNDSNDFKRPKLYNNNVKFLDASTKCELQNMKLCSKPEMDIYSQMGTNSNNCLWSNTPWVINDAKFYAGYPKNNKLVNCDTNTSQAQIMCCPRDTIIGLTSYSYLGKYKCLNSDFFFSLISYF